MHNWMPPEWAPHQRIFMEWPVPETVWGKRLHKARAAYAEVARAIREFEPVTVILNPGDEDEAADLLGPEIDILTIPHDDSWMRDNGPTFVWAGEKRNLSAVHWGFNAWGSKYPKYALDREVPTHLLSGLGIAEQRAPIILEGGSIHTNGAGTLLTTAECLLNPNRNPDFTKESIEEILREYLGVSRILFLPTGLYMDETDGHVDNIACFLDEKTVLLARTDDPSDPNYERTDAARKAILAAGLTVKDIVSPPETRTEDGALLTVSYVNFLFVNGGIVMPGFGGELSEYDRIAKGQLEQLFPERRIVQPMTREILRGGGNIHCITQQMPL